MDTMRPCVNCGHMLSSQAPRCTQCLVAQTPPPAAAPPPPALCKFCNRPESEGQHRNCYNKPGGSRKFPASIPCPTCGHDLGSSLALARRGDSLVAPDDHYDATRYHPLENCPGCGLPSPICLQRCTGCKLWFFSHELQFFSHGEYRDDTGIRGDFCPDCYSRTVRHQSREDVQNKMIFPGIPLFILIILITLFLLVCR